MYFVIGFYVISACEIFVKFCDEHFQYLHADTHTCMHMEGGQREKEGGGRQRRGREGG